MARYIDAMTFPNTVEEFMEQYKIVDTEQVYTNGTELVPIFRMKQWFEHLSTADVVEVVRCKECKHREGSVCDYSAVYVRPNGYCQWGEKETDCDYERAVEQLEHDILYEPTFNQDDGSM